eukprot:TRINITY_DN7794_c0_g1_i10.p1 TRINITY_DN7794_c0_g1~~TRINITY_DN7794_c0_g1_i10.p1  ORF type:complete len:206 (+),score=42.50 TRINITY_DN7794_c0_g1_i10:866-1483(+)
MTMVEAEGDENRTRTEGRREKLARRDTAYFPMDEGQAEQLAATLAATQRNSNKSNLTSSSSPNIDPNSPHHDQSNINFSGIRDSLGPVVASSSTMESSSRSMTASSRKDLSNPMNRSAISRTKPRETSPPPPPPPPQPSPPLPSPPALSKCDGGESLFNSGQTNIRSFRSSAIITDYQKMFEHESGKGETHPHPFHIITVILFGK